MDCPRCDKELLIDHVERRGDTSVYFYVCMNKNCDMYRKAFNPSTEETQMSKIRPKE